MTRIRYKRNGNVLTSRRVYNLKDNLSVNVVLDLDAMTYALIDANGSGAVIASGGGTKNLSVLKIKAKEGLKNLGFDFNNESRNRGVNDAIHTAE